MSERSRSRSRTRANTEEVEVVEIAVEPGQTVAQGERLLEIGHRQGQHGPRGAAGGVVEEILVAEGDVVPVTQVFAVLRT